MDGYISILISLDIGLSVVSIGHRICFLFSVCNLALLLISLLSICSFILNFFRRMNFDFIIALHILFLLPL
jgi:hypothetical protein